ncbi:hypothetical protein [uncultured Psychroserpens sp.]|uniref:hypothetical protein n=1 Tax=uncultured Psychroserpens sp. TaxID=255436 RepID=UPI002637CFEB|nr:hypothetical protein [uncultured Psychroserpens sp.]
MSVAQNIRNVLITVILLTVMSCKSSRFSYKKGDQSIELLIPNNELLINTDDISTNYATLKLTNINPSKLAITGVGVSIDKSSHNGNMYLKILSRKDYYKGQNTYDLNVSYRTNGELFQHKFQIPIRLIKNKS